MSTSNKTKLESLEFYLGLKYPITIYPDMTRDMYHKLRIFRDVSLREKP